MLHWFGLLLLTLSLCDPTISSVVTDTPSTGIPVSSALNQPFLLQYQVEFVYSGPEPVQIRTYLVDEIVDYHGARGRIVTSNLINATDRQSETYNPFPMNVFAWHLDSSIESSRRYEYIWSNPTRSMRASVNASKPYPNHVFTDLARNSTREHAELLDSLFVFRSSESKITNGMSAFIMNMLNNSTNIRTEYYYGNIVWIWEIDESIKVQVTFQSLQQSPDNLVNLELSQFFNTKFVIKTKSKTWMTLAEITLYKVDLNIRKHQLDDYLTAPIYQKLFSNNNPNKTPNSKSIFSLKNPKRSSSSSASRVTTQIVVNMRRDLATEKPESARFKTTPYTTINATGNKRPRFSMNFPQYDTPIESMPFEESLRSRRLVTIVSDRVRKLVALRNSGSHGPRVEESVDGEGSLTVLDMSDNLKHRIDFPQEICNPIERLVWPPADGCTMQMVDLNLVADEQQTLNLKLSEKTLKWLTFDFDSAPFEKFVKIDTRKLLWGPNENRFELTYLAPIDKLDQCYYLKKSTTRFEQQTVQLGLDPNTVMVMVRFISSKDDGTELEPASSTLIMLDQFKSRLELQIDFKLLAVDADYELYESNHRHFADISGCFEGNSDKVRISAEYHLMEQYDGSDIDNRLQNQVTQIRRQIFDQLNSNYQLNPVRIPSIKVNIEDSLMSIEVELLRERHELDKPMLDTTKKLAAMNPELTSPDEYRELLARSSSRYLVHNVESCLVKCQSNPKCNTLAYCPLQAACYIFESQVDIKASEPDAELDRKFGSYLDGELVCHALQLDPMADNHERFANHKQAWSLSDILGDFGENRGLAVLELQLEGSSTRLEPSNIVNDRAIGTGLSGPIYKADHDFKIFKIGYRFLAATPISNFEIDKLSDCIDLCQSEASGNICHTISFCKSTKYCGLISSGTYEHYENLVDTNYTLDIDDDCTILKRTPLDFFQVRRLKLNHYRNLSSRSLWEPSKMVASVEECASVCQASRQGQNPCLSFDACVPMDREILAPICIFHTDRQLIVVNEDKKQQDLANIISSSLGDSNNVLCRRFESKLHLSYSRQASFLANNLLTNANSSVEVKSVSLDECAQLCDQDANCREFGFCIGKSDSNDVISGVTKICSLGVSAESYSDNNNNTSSSKSTNCFVYKAKKRFIYSFAGTEPDKNVESTSMVLILFVHGIILSLSFGLSYFVFKMIPKTTGNAVNLEQTANPTSASSDTPNVEPNPTKKQEEIELKSIEHNEARVD